MVWTIFEKENTDPPFHEKLGPFSLLMLVYDSSLLRDRIARCFFQIYSEYTHFLDFDQFTMILNYFFVNEVYCFFSAVEARMTSHKHLESHDS